MRKLVSILLTLALAVSLVLAVPLGAYSSGDYTDAITKTADRLEALQGIDGGWDWEVTGLTAHSGSIPSPFNIFGVTALGLIDAYQVTGNEAYKTAAQVTADHLKTLDRASDPAVRIMSFDYRFLVEFSALSADPSYKEHAIGQWSVAKTASEFHYADGNQENIYDFWYTWTDPDSHGYAAWQAADAGLAALAMGDTSWAINMAGVLAGHLDEIVGTDECRFIGRGRALEFLNAVDSVAYSTQITSLITNLKGGQGAGGNWPGTAVQGKVQNTAYAVMGLAAVGEGNAAQAGADWLVENQISSGASTGGWIETDAKEYSEVDSEALQAIRAVLDISSSVSLIVNVSDITAISVTPTSIDFGTLIPDQTSDVFDITVNNIGTHTVDVDADVSGSALFFDNLELKNYTTGVPDWKTRDWPEIVDNLTMGSSEVLRTKLPVPPSYTPKGVETATLVFTATAV